MVLFMAHTAGINRRRKCICTVLPMSIIQMMKIKHGRKKQIMGHNAGILDRLIKRNVWFTGLSGEETIELFKMGFPLKEG